MSFIIGEEDFNTKCKVGAEIAKGSKPEKYSYTQLETYMKCPFAYKLKYYYKAQSFKSPWVDFGCDVHKALEDNDISGKHSEYVKAVNDYMAEQQDAFVSKEESFDILIGNNKFGGKIDGVTKNNWVVDFKVTGAPSYYKNKIGYQLILYRYAMKISKGLDLKPKYILLKRTSAGKYQDLEIIKIDRGIKEATENIMVYARYILEKLNKAWEDMVFEPTFSNCTNCFYKSACQYVNYGGGSYF